MRIMTRVASPMLSDCRGRLRVAIILAYFGLKINYLCQFLAKALGRLDDHDQLICWIYSKLFLVM
jgi:hypothetical protein